MAAAVVSLDPTGARPLASALRAEGLPVARTVGWGVRGFQQILSHRETVLLDAPDDFGTGELYRAIRALRYLGPVIALYAGPVDVPAGLAAGAVNILDRELPVTQLAARIHADLRWLGRYPKPMSDGADLPPGERVLMRLLARSRTPICCHQLRWLLGHGRAPIGRDALRARLHRVEPALRRYGLRLRRDSGWGSSTYSVQPLT
jgi:DNA-binding response OmpR family regulator